MRNHLAVLVVLGVACCWLAFLWSIPYRLSDNAVVWQFWILMFWVLWALRPLVRALPHRRNAADWVIVAPSVFGGLLALLSSPFSYAASTGLLFVLGALFLGLWAFLLRDALAHQSAVVQLWVIISSAWVLALRTSDPDLTSLMGFLALTSFLTFWLCRWTSTPATLVLWLLLSPVVLSVVMAVALPPFFYAWITHFFTGSPLVTASAEAVTIWSGCSITVWCITTRYHRNTDVVKVALSVANNVVRTGAAVSFLVTLLNDSQMPAIIAKLATFFGTPPQQLADIALKIVFLPYVIAGIWATTVLDLRTYIRSISSTRIIDPIGVIKRALFSDLEHPAEQQLLPMEEPPQKPRAYQSNVSKQSPVAGSRNAVGHK